MATLYRYRFGSAVFDESTAELQINGLAVDLRPQSLRILSLLLAKRGEIVSKKELDEQVWEGRDVGENAIASAITRLRNSLGQANEGLIESIPRIGYRLGVPIQCTPVGHNYASRLELSPGLEVPGRPGIVLERMLGQSNSGEVWLAQNVKSKVQRVFKFAATSAHLSSLKREATISRVLFEQLGERGDIARLLDWNFEQPPFFLESEYGGEDLLAWSLQDNTLAAMSRAERIALFLDVATAVATAHSVGVIHKDLKPGNILLTCKDGARQIRLVDFGSGRLLDANLLAELSIVELGATMTQGIGSDTSMGTLLYIAPELLRQQPSTVRTDVFALGVLLFQLMVGDLRRPMAPGWEREIDDALLAEDIARATDGDPARRCSTVVELIQALVNLEIRRSDRTAQHALQAQAIADRETARQARQRRPWIAGIIASLLVGLTISGVSYFRLQRSEQSLVRQNQVTLALNHFLQDDLIAQADPAITGRTDITVKDAAINAASKIDTSLATSTPEIRAALHATLQSTLFSLGEYTLSIEQGKKAIATLQSDLIPDSATLTDVRLYLAISYAAKSQFSEAEAQLDSVKNSLQNTVSDAGARYWWTRGQIAMTRAARDEGLADYAKATDILSHANDAKPDTEEIIGFSSADAYKMTGNVAAAEALYKSLIAKETLRHGANHPRTCYTSLGLANTLAFDDKVKEAIEIAQSAARCLEKALGPTNVHTATSHEVLANAYFEAEDYKNAAAEYELTARQYSVIRGEAAVPTINEWLMTARSLQYSGHADQCAPLLEKTLLLARKTLDDTSPLTEAIRYHMVDCRLDRGDKKDVDSLLNGLTPASLNNLEPEGDWEGRIDYQLGRLNLLNGNKSEGIALLGKAAQIIAAKNPDGRISEADVRRLIKTAQGH